jgi:AcrR family transcriptional regulator
VNSHDFANGHSGGDDAAIGRRARKARATRRALLDSGLDAFQRQPIALVSVLDITEAADVAKGVFYLHFANKDAFLIALWDDVHDVFLAAVMAAVAGVDVRDRRLRLEAAIGEYARTAAAQPRRVCFLLRMSSFIGDELGTPGQLVERTRAFVDALARAIFGIAKASRVRKADLAAAGNLDACCWGFIWHSLRLGQKPPSAKELIAMALPAALPAGKGIPSA